MKRYVLLLTAWASSLFALVGAYPLADIASWTGEGDTEVALVIAWNDGRSPEALAWGYRGTVETTVIAMLNEVVKADPRLFSLTRRQGGYTVDGLGFDLNGENTVALVVGGNTTYPKYQTSGLFTSTPGNYNRWTCTDEEDHWNSPSEAEPGVWRCLEQQPDGTTVEADVNATRLQAGATYLFLYEKADGSRPDYTGAVAVEPYEQAPVDYTQGLFLVNEDWYGWDNGTVNFLTSDGRWVYRAFRRENPGETLGVTTQYGAIYGGRFFFVSKQASSTADASTGGRLVVADALTLKKVAAFDEIGGDGRSFVGVDEHTAYIGTSSGITRLDLESMSLGETIAGTGGEGGLYAGQIGAMVRAGSYVFAAKQSVGVLVIDAATHTLHTTIDLPTISTLTLGRDGGVWAADATSLVRIDVATLETRSRLLPDDCRVSSTWGAWNAGSLCAAYRNNFLYFANEKGNQIARYHIPTDELDADFFTLPDQDKAYVQQFQGAGLRVDPRNDRLFVITTESGYLSHYMNNWIHVVDGHSGELLDTVELERYYWFMAMPVFPDNEAPVIALPDRLSIGREPVKISLLEAVTDADNLSASIVSAVEVEDSSVATARISGYDLTVNGVNVGDTRLTLTVNSNGKKATRTVDVQVTEASGIDEAMCTAVEAWPNPVHDRLTIVAVDGSVFGLVDLRGIPVCRGVVSGGKAAVDLSAIAPGIYVLTVQNGGSVKNMQIVKR
ncbi:DUF5074 domain-containing protein [Barnesiella viscericola]|uniref:DUF5074 domain-containing protein n=1 Tax=Barnesiella viscericola TaxID=397865 RepID=UPI0025A4A2A3|nr:DUF5074 domain-containing protein [Barnesiella viscericola]MDM8269714.1 DUF5074 domain-containing protein [Barnesiella viscericola]